MAFFLAPSPLALLVAFELTGGATFLLVGLFGRAADRFQPLFTSWATGPGPLSSLARWLWAPAGPELDRGWRCWSRLVAPFLVKLPLVPLHDWLLRAHREASLTGSLLLAALLLKLGTVGLVRMGVPSGGWLVGLALGAAGRSPWTLRQTQAKRLVAASSLGHVAASRRLLARGEEEGALLLAVAHGLASP